MPCSTCGRSVVGAAQFCQACISVRALQSELLLPSLGRWHEEYTSNLLRDLVRTLGTLRRGLQDLTSERGVLRERLPEDLRSEELPERSSERLARGEGRVERRDRSDFGARSARPLVRSHRLECGAETFLPGTSSIRASLDQERDRSRRRKSRR